MAAEQPVEFKPEREVRFAVVMYGGVSLAIYINGVAQELLNLVRATAPNEAGSSEPLLVECGKCEECKNGEKCKNCELAGSAGVYRKLGQYLNGDEDDDLQWSTWKTPTKSPIRTRFVVDVISGTSAGGINGVFLAKALAQNQKMDGLKKLWLSEGDLAKLLNDSSSVQDMAESGYTIQEPRQSLLNSQRMYRKLLEALEQMDETPGSISVYRRNGKSPASPLVSELDLFITTTDIEGLPLPLSLADRVVFERRHKNVFHFRYSGPGVSQNRRDDFDGTNDPFLAYAARCTSSFPFAFEPMRLEHINEVLEGYPRYSDAADHRENWDHFFSEYLRPALFDLDKEARGEPCEGDLPRTASGSIDTSTDATGRLRDAFQTRSFGDGGYLDNKPFSYATAMLMRRHADCEVERKLLYIEPSPEHPELLRSNPDMPDFAENVRAAVLDLPRKETIREDLDRLYERNLIVERVATYAREVDADVMLFPQKEPLDHKEFCAAGLGEMMEHYGIGFGAYHRLKVGEITSFLAEIVTRAKGHDPSSDAGAAIRELASAWRRDKYTPVRHTPVRKRANGEPQQTENQFLVDFDVRYRLRRVIFLIRRLNEFLHLDPARNEKMDERTERLLGASLGHLIKKREADLKVLEEVRLEERQVDAQVLEEITKREIDLDVLKQVTQWLEPPDDSPAATKDKTSGNSAPRALDKKFQVWLEGFVRELRRIKRDALAPGLSKARSTEEELLGCAPAANQKDDQKQKPKTYSEGHLEHLQELLSNLKLPWTGMKGILQFKGLARAREADRLFEDHQKEFDAIGRVIKSYLALRRSDLKDALGKGKIRGTGPSAPLAFDCVDREKYCEEGERAARLCLIDCDENFVRYDMVTYPVGYGTGAGEANKVEVYRVSPEDAVGLIDERATKREKLAGRALMSFGAFLDKGWRKNDMLWGRLDGAERLICALLPMPEAIMEAENETPERKGLRERIDRKRERRAALIKEAHVAILKEELESGDIKTLCDLIGATLARCEPSSDEERKLRAVVEGVIGAQDLPATMRSALYRCLDKPEKIWDYYNKDFKVNRQLEAETALRLISRATNITGKMLEGLADKYGYDRGKNTAVWIARLGSAFWNTIAVAVPQSLANLFFRHWLGLLYVFSTLLIFAGIAFTAAGALGWKFLGVTVALHLVTSLLGDFMAGAHRKLIAARVVLIAVVVGLLACGAYFVAKQLSTVFVQINEVAVAVAVAGIVLILRGAADWRRTHRTFRAAPDASFRTSTLVWLTALTLALGWFLRWIGPPGIVQLEFARTAASVSISEALKPKLYLQLGVDYLFLVVYTVTLASYCVAAAKLFWQRLDILQQTTKTKAGIDTAKGKVFVFRTRLLNWLVTIGFIMAGLQCLAGAADAVENAGLILFLRNQNEAGLQLAYYCAFLKFGLVALGGLYSAFGFATGLLTTPRRRWLYLLALIGLLIFIWASLVLWCVPLHHSNPCLCYSFNTER